MTHTHTHPHTHTWKEIDYKHARETFIKKKIAKNLQKKS